MPTDNEYVGGHPGYLRVLERMREMHIEKSHDYGFRDPLANLRAAEELGIQPWVGCILRANDKVTRIKSFLQSGQLKNESVQDSLMDIAAYAILALVLFEEEQHPLEPTSITLDNSAARRVLEGVTIPEAMLAPHSGVTGDARSIRRAIRDQPQA